MTRDDLKNVAASVRQRLLNTARATGRPFNELLQYFAMERFLYRLSISPESKRFVLKGGLLLRSWEVARSRPTKDIDLLGQVGNDVDDVDDITSIMAGVCGEKVPQPDGIHFDPESVAGERIAEDAEYAGVRVRLLGHLGTARVSVQIDIGFGDAVVPGPVTGNYPTILDHPAPRIRSYTRESVIAEKFHAMVRRGLLNSRTRDFFDIWTLSRQFDFDGAVLSAAIQETFERRHLPIDSEPVALTAEFSSDPSKLAQWRGFLRKSRIEGPPLDFSSVMENVGAFLAPAAQSLAGGRDFNEQWYAPGPWTVKRIDPGN